MERSTAEDVLEYWFGPDVSRGSWQEKADTWFAGGPAVDEEITARFAETLKAASNQTLDSWADSPEGRLALIVVLDQFSRNIHRGEGEAFACDEKTLALTMDGIERGHDTALHPVQRLFFYMPLMHAESMWCQDLCMEKLQELHDRAAAEGAPYQKLFSGALDAGHEHREIIARFGRYPHRNASLGRASTEAELAFLADGGPSFGQGNQSEAEK